MALELEDAKPRRQGLVEWFGFTNAELARAAPAGACGAVVGGMVALALPLPAWAGPGVGLLVLVLGIAVGFALGMLIVRTVMMWPANRIATAVMPTGNTTPSRPDYSREDALLMQRDVAGALASFEHKIASDPRLVDARLRAADLYVKEGKDPRRAEALLREVQRIPGVARQDDVYASSRLVDLYSGVLDDPGRAVVELRRLVERHPGTRAAEDARRGLATLKARLLEDRERES